MRLRMVVALAAVVTLGMLLTGRSARASACPSGPRAPMIVHRGVGLRPPGQSAAVPLVIGLHSSESSPSGFEHTSGLDRLADQNGFVVAYPSSQTPTTSAWALCNMSSNLAYIGSSIRQLTRSQNIDPSRVYITGFSAGATMTFRAGCALSDQIAAIAPVSGWMWKRRQACALSRPESMMLFIGTRDAISVNGTSLLMSGTGMGTFWARLDGCRTGPAIVPGAVTQYRWSRCSNASAVAVNVIAGGSHAWPPAGSGADRTIDASAAMWRFFSAHPAASGGPPVAVSAGRQWVRITVPAKATPIRLTAVLSAHGRRIAKRMFHLSRGRRVAILGLPNAAAAGRYRLTLMFTDRSGDRRTIVRAITVP